MAKIVVEIDTNANRAQSIINSALRTYNKTLERAVPSAAVQYEVLGTVNVHWRGTAPTSLHGNGASSFEFTSEDVSEVTCKLCLHYLSRLEDE